MHRSLLLAALVFPNCAIATERKPPLAVGAGPGIVYRLPSTSLSLSADLVLRSCTDKEIVADATVAIVASGGASDVATYRLNADGLMAAAQKRDVAVELYDNGTLKSLNTVADDRTGAIVINVFKAVAQVAGAFVGVAAPVHGVVPPPQRCNRMTLDALETMDGLRKAVQQQREILADPTTPVADTEKVAKLIDMLVQQLASLEAGPLRLTLSTPLDIDQGRDADRPVQWSMGDVRKWLAKSGDNPTCMPESTGVVSVGTGCAAKVSTFALSYRVQAARFPAQDPIVGTECAFDPAKDQTGCGEHVAIAIPVAGKLTLKTVGTDIGGKAAGTVLGVSRFPVPQWGQVALVPLTVKAFRSRTLELAFDPFGTITKLKWTSAATAENATSNAAGIAEAALPLIKASRGDSQLKTIQDESTLIEARIKLQALRACETLVAEGATTCPAAQSVSSK